MIAITLTPRRRAVAWARRMVADPDVVFLDTETTGLGPDAEIVDIAIVERDGRVLLDQLVCPLKTIPAAASTIHGITEKTVANAPLWSEVYDRVAAALRDRLLVVYNGAYDVGIVRQVCTAHHQRDPIAGWQCAMLAMADWLGEPSTRGDGFRWPKLGEACAHFGIDVGGAHRALADAEACRRVVGAMAATEPLP